MDAESLPLIDIHFPENPGLWPLAPGWWILLLLAILFSIWLIITLLRKAKLRKQRQIILSKFKQLENQLKSKPDNKVIADINILLRQLAITHYPRTEIASLTGAEWLGFLDKSGKTQSFSKGAGRVLVDAPYQLDNVSNLNLAEFTPLIGSWVKRTVRLKREKKGGGV